MSNLEISYMTDIGERSTNEDRVVARCLDGRHLLAVADGIGGHAAGEVASGVALIEVERALQLNVEKGQLRSQAKDAVARANKEIYLLARESPDYAGMGTTLVLALVRGNDALVANVGDSRAYHLTENQMLQITRDHTIVQELLDGAMITEQEAKHHPLRSTLTRTLGIEPEVKVDLYDVALWPGDVLMLCSDGLTDSVTDKEIEHLVRSASDLDGACASLISHAKKKGTEDNTSIIVARRRRD